MKFYQSKEFLALQRKWGKKLKTSGFEDIENGETGYLACKISVAREAKRPERARSLIEYYTMASKFLWDFTFKSQTDYQIWFYYSEGLSYREIASRIKGQNLSSVNKVLNAIRPVFITYMQEQWEFDEQSED